MYLGPKDKSLFDKNQRFRDLGFVHVIDFSGCCCPSSIINPLAFLILAIMKGMHTVLFNYGLVIIVLVLLMRLAMHPITKKSQIAMNKMGKLAPKAEEIRKKYANNKPEMNKQMMALYREQGASPIMGFVPMLVQMPIWIALWSCGQQQYRPAWGEVPADLDHGPVRTRRVDPVLPGLRGSAAGTQDRGHQPPADPDGRGLLPPAEVYPHPHRRHEPPDGPATEDDDVDDADHVPADALQHRLRREPVHHDQHVCRGLGTEGHPQAHPGKRTGGVPRPGRCDEQDRWQGQEEEAQAVLQVLGGIA